jgi:hypothetical protein
MYRFSLSLESTLLKRGLWRGVWQTHPTSARLSLMYESPPSEAYDGRMNFLNVCCGVGVARRHVCGDTIKKIRKKGCIESKP